MPYLLLYFKTKGWRGGSNGDVAHVELYYGDGKIIGQDEVGPGGTGPTLRSFRPSEMYRDYGFKTANDSSSKYSTDPYDRYIATARYVGSGTGLNSFVSQADPAYAGKKIHGRSFEDAGCGPAVAAMAAAASGVDLSVDEAVRKSIGYQDNQGVKSGYFEKVLGDKGIGTDYTDNTEDIVKKLANGEPVVMLGNDPNNISKKKSPWGPGNHYILGKGFTPDGRVIVNDPEGSGTTTYSPDILRNTKLGIGTSLDSNGKKEFTYSGGDSAKDSKTAQLVYAWLTSNGYSPAAAAGIMGNMAQESGVNPEKIQGNGRGPAAGIVQWENYNAWKYGKDEITGTTDASRFGNMAKYALEKGRDWTDLESQLEFMNKELYEDNNLARFELRNGQYHDAYVKQFKKAGLSENDATTLDAFKNSTDAAKAAAYFEAVFERAGTPVMENRIQSAKDFYSMYSGSDYTGNWKPGSYNPVEATDSSYGITNGVSGDPLSQFNAIMNYLFTGQLPGSVGSTTNPLYTGGYTYGETVCIVSITKNGNGIEMVTLSNGEVMSLDDYNKKYFPDGGKSVQNAIVKNCKARVETEIYSQGKRGQAIKDSRYPNLVRYSDCSYFAASVIRQVVGKEIGGDCAEQYDKAHTKNGAMYVVFESHNCEAKDLLDILQPGDLVYYWSDTYKNGGTKKDGTVIPANYRVKQGWVSHVEIYCGNDEIYGQTGKLNYDKYASIFGNGAGPMKKQFSTYNKSRVFMVTRLRDLGKLFTNKNGGITVGTPDLLYYDSIKDRYIWSDGMETYSTNYDEGVDVWKKGNRKKPYVVEDGSKGILWSDGNYIIPDKNYTGSTKTKAVSIIGYDGNEKKFVWDDGTRTTGLNHNGTGKAPEMQKVTSKSVGGTGDYVIYYKAADGTEYPAMESSGSGSGLKKFRGKGSRSLLGSGTVFNMNSVKSKEVSSLAPSINRDYNRFVKKNIKTSASGNVSINTASSGSGTEMNNITYTELKPSFKVATTRRSSSGRGSRVYSGGASGYYSNIDMDALKILLTKLNATLESINSNTSSNPALATAMVTFAANTTTQANANTRAIMKQVQNANEEKKTKEYNDSVDTMIAQLETIING